MRTTILPALLVAAAVLLGAAACDSPPPVFQTESVPRDIRAVAEDWPAEHRLWISDDVVVLFDYPPADRSGAATIHHIPSASKVELFPIWSYSFTYRSVEGRDAIRAVLADDVWMERILARIPAGRRAGWEMLAGEDVGVRTPVPAPGSPEAPARDELLAWIENKSEGSKLRVNDEVLVILARRGRLSDWAGAAFITHLPSLSSVTLYPTPGDSSFHYRSKAGREALEAVLADQKQMTLILRWITDWRRDGREMLAGPGRG